ncbi:MAG: glutamine--tRNA ligase, partial [Spirochaetaceae bacterium]|nr:glutamine--tRNA ligase [Spirochaetaceae bacterium]
ENWEEDRREILEAVNNPEDPSAGNRGIVFSRELWIEEEDFEETPPPQYYRLFPGNSVRLRYAYIITCTGFDRDPVTGRVSAVRAVYDPATKGGNASDNRKVKSTIHWVSVSDSIPLEARLYDYLFSTDRPMDVPDGGSFLDNLTPDSLEIVRGYGEPSLALAAPEDRYQFERLGYFTRDRDTVDGMPVFNKTLGLRDTWAKIKRKKSP